MLDPGANVGGYTVSALLGEGGMGSVYAGVRELDGTEVALKVLRSVRPEHLERARAEASAQARLDSVHVVRVVEVLEHQNQPVMVMERVHGPSLREWLEAGRPSLADALTVFRGVSAGVRHAHDQGLIHRDLKPSNVLLSVTDEGVIPKVADFGLVRVDGDEARTTRTGVMLGTPGYMAPEQIRDAKRADRRADVFALGVLLYELVCGRAPIDQNDVITAHQQMVERSWDDPEPLGAPPDVATAIRAALAPEPDDRPQDVDALLALLDPGATYVDENRGPTVMLPTGAGAARARALEARPVTPVVDPTRPALRTAIAPPEGGLVGRDELLASLARKVMHPGALVVKGPPGIGKTASVRALARFQGTHRAWTGGVWWVDLRDAPSVEREVARVLGMAEDGAVGPALERRGRLLLVLDEVEGHAAEAAEVVARWVEEAPLLSVMLTSRAALGALPVVEVQPLSVGEGVALFLKRARQSRSDWYPTDEERADAALLVERLDGMPLAIELAAARARTLSPRDLLERLERRLDLLRKRGDDPRRASLRGAIASSWELLGAEERRAASWLSVAVGSLAPVAAEQILDSLGPAPFLLLEGLEAASWLALNEGSGPNRYRMLASLRAFAREQLDDADRDLAWRAHADVVLARAERALRDVDQQGSQPALSLLEQEVEDLLAVMDRFDDGLGRRAAGAAARALGLLGQLDRASTVARNGLVVAEALGEGVAEHRVILAECLSETLRAEAREVVKQALAGPLDDRLFVRAWVARGRGADLSEDLTPGLTEAIDRARRLGDPVVEARILRARATVHELRGERVDAERLVEAALSLIRQAGHELEEADLLSYLGLIRLKLEDYEGAERALVQANEVAARRGLRRVQAGVLGRLSMVLARDGRRDEAREALEQALSVCRQLGDLVGEGYSLLNLGALEPEPAEAANLFRQAGALGRRAESWRLEAFATRNLGTTEILRGHPERALEPLGRVADRMAERGDASAFRLRCWHGVALLASGDPTGARDRVSEGEPATAEEERIAGIVQIALEEAADPSGDLEARVAAVAGVEESRSWDVTLTLNLVRASLAPTG